MNYFPILMAFLANFILGASSIYWHLFSSINPVSLVAYRIFFSLAFLFLILFIKNKLLSIIKSMDYKLMVIHSLGAILVAINWGVFIWASIHGNVIESGLGYLIAPIFVMIIGIFILGERRDIHKIYSISLISIFLCVLIMYSGNIEHWVYLTIGITWGMYTIVKKKTSLPPLDGLFIETVVLFIIICIYLLFFKNEILISTTEVNNFPLLYFCGIVSVIPLIMFSFAAKKLGAYSMGALQFVLPTTQLLVSIIYYHQSVPIITYVCFILIWVTLIIFTYYDISKPDVMRAK